MVVSAISMCPINGEQLYRMNVNVVQACPRELCGRRVSSSGLSLTDLKPHARPRVGLASWKQVFDITS